MSPKYLPLTGLPIGLVPAPVIVCGDPQRASQVAEFFQQSELLATIENIALMKERTSTNPIPSES